MKRHHKISLVLAAVVLVAATLATLVPRTLRAAPPCPCSVWASDPSVTTISNGQPLELGVKFTADVDGYVLGVKFYKATGMGGTHTGHLWDQYGNKLAEAVFTGETATGWQTVTFANPVEVTANVLYVASFHAADGEYVRTTNGLTSAVDNSPLHVPADNTAGAMDGFGDNRNGKFTNGVSAFPYQNFNANNYWVDVVFDTTATDTVDPLVSQTQPTNGSFGVSPNGPYTVKFNEMMDPATITSSTFTLTTSGGAPVAGTVSYDTGSMTASITPDTSLAVAGYTLTVQGGSGAAVEDLAGNALAADFSWTFTTGPSSSITPGTGPGGPILVITSTTNKFTTYFTEILRAEGYNEFAVTDISSVTSGTLAGYDVAILGEMSLSAGQVSTLTTWVQGGGRLVASRPDKQLAGLLGITDASTTLSDGYIKVDAATAPGYGIVSQTMQFHGTADQYTLSGATPVADLYTDATTATAYPAVTQRTVGSGKVAAFTYDLAKSVVYQRQGNPAWVGQERDGISPVRPNDMFYPDWVNLDKVAIPQADEQQRLLANLIVDMTAGLKPLPHFWYFPKAGANTLPKAAVVMVLDDHGSALETAGAFARLSGESPAACSVADWTCYRGTSWLYATAGPSDTQAEVFYKQGFDLGVHINTGCADWTLPQLQAAFTNDLAAFQAKYTSLPPQTGGRVHCLPWNDWASVPKTSATHGIRLDMGYYYYPGAWILERPGFMTGSGIPMRYADSDGSIVDVYQQPTHMANDSGMTYPAAITTQLDNAVGSAGYYGAIGTHHDEGSSNFQIQLIEAAKARNLPIVSAHQLLTWQDGRGASSFSNFGYTGNNMSFDITAASGSTGMQALLPTSGPTGALTTVKLGGSVLSYSTASIKGVDYAVFAAAPGSYTACYGACSSPPPAPSPSPTPTPTSTPAPAPTPTPGAATTTPSTPPQASESAAPTTSPSTGSPSPTSSPAAAGQSKPATNANALVLGVAAGGLGILAIGGALLAVYLRRRARQPGPPLA